MDMTDILQQLGTLWMTAGYVLGIFFFNLLIISLSKRSWLGTLPNLLGYQSR